MKRAGKLSVYLLSLMLVVFLTAVPAAAAEGESESGLSKDLVILFTSDVHCGVDQNFGLDGLYQVRKYYEDQGCYTLLVDDGDFIQGEPIGTMTKGETPLELMNAAGYDIAIPGNHEFDYGMDQFLALTKKAKFPYISCNFNKDGKLVFNPNLTESSLRLSVSQRRRPSPRPHRLISRMTPETLCMISARTRREKSSTQRFRRQSIRREMKVLSMLSPWRISAMRIRLRRGAMTR